MALAMGSFLPRVWGLWQRGFPRYGAVSDLQTMSNSDIGVQKRAFAMGIASTGNSCGGMLYPIMVRQLLPQLGFAWTVRVLGFRNLGVVSLVVTFMKARLPPRKSGDFIDKSAFKELPFMLFITGLFFQVWCIYFTLYYISSFGVEALGLPFSRSIDLLRYVHTMRFVFDLLRLTMDIVSIMLSHFG